MNYTVVTGQDPDAEKAMFDSAVRYMHMLLLRDFSPPWLMRKFPQALPGMVFSHAIPDPASCNGHRIWELRSSGKRL